jgi:hypothetical protein
LVDWWLTPTLAVFQLYRGVSRFNNFKKLKTTMFIDVTYQTLRMSTEYDSPARERLHPINGNIVDIMD